MMGHHWISLRFLSEGTMGHCTNWICELLVFGSFGPHESFPFSDGVLIVPARL